MAETDDSETKVEQTEGGVRGFLVSQLVGIVRDLFKFVIAFVVGTGASAIVCWYYGIPLALSLLGGILVLALALAFLSDSVFA